MPKHDSLQDAVRNSVQTEKNAMDFYLLGAKNMKDTDAKKTFELLAREEREHAEQFYRIYKGSDLPQFEEFINAPPAKDGDWLTDLEKMMMSGFNERKAMEMAMEKEQMLEKALREMAGKIEDPAIRAVYEANAKSTRHHYEVIESEYARLMGMVHETDIDTYVRE